MTADWCVAWKENFGLGISIGELCRLKANAPQLVTTVRHKRQYSSLSHAKVQPKQQQQFMSDKELLEVRHGAATSASQLQKIRKVVPCMRGWTLERVRQAELLLIPQFDRSIGNTGLLHSIVQFLFLGNAQHVKEHCKGGRILRAEYTLRLFLYGDVYSPRGTPIVCQKVAIVDPQGCLLPPKGRDIPGCTQLLTWRELLKADYVAWRVGRVEEMCINTCVCESERSDNPCPVCVWVFMWRPSPSMVRVPVPGLCQLHIQEECLAGRNVPRNSANHARTVVRTG